MSRLGRRAFVAAMAFVSPLLRTVAVAQAFSLDDFLALSSRLTGQRDLDRDAAEILLKALLATPGNAQKLRQPDAALEREIIAAWYTGMYTLRGEQRLATHTGALQWRALGMPAPGSCSDRFGAWADPPRPIAR
jgi:hypothetical protein